MVDARSQPTKTTEPLTTRWEAPTIEVERIRDELATLWVEWAYRYGESSAVVTGDLREQVYMRPSTMNVIAVTGGEEAAAYRRCARLVAGLLAIAQHRALAEPEG